MKTAPSILPFAAAALVTVGVAACSPAGAPSEIDPVRYATENVDGVDVFYREAGDPSNPAIVLLHGFPSSSYQYREVVAELSDEFYVIAPDYPGFGNSAKPTVADYEYTFDNLAVTMGKFLEQKEVSNYFLAIHDYGAPVGFRMALADPDDVAGFIVMNGNAYEAGLSEITQQTLATPRTPEDEAYKTQAFMSFDGIKWMYTTGAANPASMSPDGWTMDHALITEPHVVELNLDLLYDYPNNLTQYPDWHDYLRQTQPPMLIVWGKNDPIFPESGAAAYRQDVEDIDYNIYDTGHFPLEEHAPEIIEKMRAFVRRNS